MATNVRPSIGLDLPRPGRAALPFALLCVAALGFEADRRLPWIVGALAAGSFGGAAALRAYRARRELEAVRRTVDRLIVLEPHSSETSALVRWRSFELTAPAYRRILARETNRVLSMLDPKSLPGASPLRRPAARRSEDLLRLLAAKLGGDQPVTARGVLLARQLLRDPGSPLFSDESEHHLPQALKRVLGALET
ncbi:MAG TPA: hypothetical protein VNY33_09710 [Gaiellaceae bacterium]|nr:hypothetical protein [Gaiellaceae bacterium]